jgi:biotin synthase
MKLEEIMDLFDMPLSELAAKADKVRRERTDNKLDVCTICNARSGLCSEDCKFCAQSVHYDTGTPVYPMMNIDEIMESALQAKANGSKRFGIVTSGQGLNMDEVGYIATVVKEIRDKLDIEVCASLGCLDYDQLTLLKKSGLSRYHHNIETSREFFPKIVSTHTFDDRIVTIRNAIKAGLSTCSGGIIGMGESRRDRADMALTLKDLDVDSVPINVLMPLAGTPLVGTLPITISEVMKTVAVFRILMPDKTIKLAAGRESFLKDFQGMAFMSGANGMLIGGYLTQRGRSVEEDKNMIDEINHIWNL